MIWTSRTRDGRPNHEAIKGGVPCRTRMSHTPAPSTLPSTTHSLSLPKHQRTDRHIICLDTYHSHAGSFFFFFFLSPASQELTGNWIEHQDSHGYFLFVSLFIFFARLLVFFARLPLLVVPLALPSPIKRMEENKTSKRLKPGSNKHSGHERSKSNSSIRKKKKDPFHPNKKQSKPIQNHKEKHV